MPSGGSNQSRRRYDFGGSHYAPHRACPDTDRDALLAQSSSPYRITHTYTPGGDGSWDYIIPDPPNHRLFIGRQTRVMVVDENNGKLLGEVTGVKGADGIALADATGHGFAKSGTDESVVIFQDAPDKYHVIQTLQTAPASRNLGLDPTTHRVFVAAAKFGPPPAGGTGRGAMVPGSFSLMVIERDPATP
jgi:hypothetical protein